MAYRSDTLRGVARSRVRALNDTYAQRRLFSLEIAWRCAGDRGRSECWCHMPSRPEWWTGRGSVRVCRCNWSIRTAPQFPCGFHPRARAPVAP